MVDMEKFPYLSGLLLRVIFFGHDDGDLDDPVLHRLVTPFIDSHLICYEQKNCSACVRSRQPATRLGRLSLLPKMTPASPMDDGLVFQEDLGHTR